MTPKNIFELYDQWNGLLMLAFGIYALLMGYGILPRNPKDPEKIKIWRMKFGKMMKICGYILVVLGPLKVILNLLK